MALPDGLYDQLLTEELWQSLFATTNADTRLLNLLREDEAPSYLADALVAQLKAILEDLREDGKEKLLSQLDLVNSLLVNLRQRLNPQTSAAEVDMLVKSSTAISYSSAALANLSEIWPKEAVNTSKWKILKPGS